MTDKRIDDLKGHNTETFKNKARCKVCESVIESKHRYELVWCKCGKIFVDGGNDYWRAGGDFKAFERIYEKH